MPFYLCLQLGVVLSRLFNGHACIQISTEHQADGSCERFVGHVNRRLNDCILEVVSWVAQ